MAERRPNRTLGPVHDEFWAYCRDDQLRLPRCTTCMHYAWPPLAACERCGSGELTWEQMTGTGRVISWCTFEHRYYAEIDVPWDTILVELDEGPMFISNPVEFSVDGATLGMPVRVTFIDCEDDAGPFRLPVFEPV